MIRARRLCGLGLTLWATVGAMGPHAPLCAQPPAVRGGDFGPGVESTISDEAPPAEFLAREPRPRAPIVTVPAASPRTSERTVTVSAPSIETSERARLFQEIAIEVDAIERQSALLKKVVRLVQPTVVHIEATKSDTTVRYRRDPVEEAGSGVLVELRGRPYIVTNRHVIVHADLAQIDIKLADGRHLRPAAVWTDAASDIAVLGLDETELDCARLGDSDSLEIGDYVLAVGSPFGLSHSVTTGIISAKGRRDLELGDDGVKFQEFLQTDAAINPGNSGGPLLNLRGEVIGINTAIASASGGNEGIGFAIPIKMVLFVARQLVENGQVSRAYLGVQLDARFKASDASRLGLPKPYGARVSGVTPGSPAAAARLQVNDVVLQFDGVEVENDSHLINLVSVTAVGSEVDVVLLRGGRVQTIGVRVGNRGHFEREE